MIVGLVEADVTVVSYSEQLDINAAHRLYDGVISLALCLGISRDTGGKIGILLVDINVIKKIGAHKVGVGLIVIGGKTYVLIQVYALDVLEGYLAASASRAQLLIHSNGRGACGKAEHRIGLILYYIRHNVCGGVSNATLAFSVYNFYHFRFSFVGS